MIEKVTLENEFARLEPLDQIHADGLWEAGNDAAIWEFMPITMTVKEHVPLMIGHAQKLHANGECLAFAIIEPKSGTVVGSTGYWNVDLPNKRVEIGFTWIAPKWQRTAINTACKLLLLEHAFDNLDLNRVEFKTDALNSISQRALHRIGATKEGTLRQHMIQPDGRVRDSVYFSIVKSEWPETKTRLESFFERVGEEKEDG